MIDLGFLVAGQGLPDPAAEAALPDSSLGTVRSGFTVRISGASDLAKGSATIS